MQVFITGVSKGLGKALATAYLSLGEEVIGIGRSHAFTDKNFRFISCDLENLEQVNNLDFGKLSASVLFINNAGIIGSIERISEQTSSDIQSVLNANTLAPMLLCQKIVKVFTPSEGLTIVNISSGAGKRAIPSWASYCASKAALDIFSETIYLEEKERGRNVKIYALSPGVIDTEMQKKIRSTNTRGFSSSDAFKELKTSGKLVQPEHTAQKIIQLLAEEYSGEVIYSLKNS
jgi:benzil reductase ((S)-benzoin forming)